jgi:hypothetical protein
MKSRGMGAFSGYKLEKEENAKLELFKFLRVTNIAGDHEWLARRKQEAKLGELWGLLLWVYFMGVPSTVPRSGKPGWPTDGGEACGPSGGPVAVDPDGRCPAQEQGARSNRH